VGTDIFDVSENTEDKDVNPDKKLVFTIMPYQIGEVGPYWIYTDTIYKCSRI
jgi:hypothetical protein